MTFEEKLKRLEEINGFLKDPATGLDKAIELYEEGAKIKKDLEQSLENVERRIEKVITGENEPVKTEPFQLPVF